MLLANGDQTFFIRYKKERILIEERAGRKSQGWTAAKAHRLRTERLAGKSESNITKRLKEKFWFRYIGECLILLCMIGLNQSKRV